MIYVADSSSYLNILLDYDKPLPAGMSQGQHPLVKLVSIPEGPARKAEQTQGQAFEGTSHSGFSGMSLKLGV